MEYYKVVGPPEAFYRAGLMYLSFANSTSLPEQTQKDLARDLSLAALSGSDIFNFGEVFMTPILQVLKGTQDEYLLSLMEAFTTGDINAYNSVMKNSGALVKSQPALTNKAVFIQEKITLLALVNMIFSRPSWDRCIPFEEISARAQVPMEQVEWVVMRALSLDLIKGKMDQMDQTVKVTWCLPRVLNMDQILEMKGRIDEWKDRVKNYEGVVQEGAMELMH